MAEPQISFNYLGQFDQVFGQSELFKPSAESCGVGQSFNNPRPFLLDINVLIANGQLRVTWTYSENVHRRETIERLAGYFSEYLKGLILHCQSPESGGYTPSDFPDAELTQEKLDEIIARLGKGVAKPSIEAIYPLS